MANVAARSSLRDVRFRFAVSSMQRGDYAVVAPIGELDLAREHASRARSSLSEVPDSPLGRMTEDAVRRLCARLDLAEGCSEA